MNHLTEEQLILYRYGEVAERHLIASHLESCESCRANYEVLQRVLAAADTLPVPPRTESYGAEVWRQLSPQIVKSAKSSRPGFWQLFPLPRWALTGAFALVVFGAFVTGRFLSRKTAITTPVVVQATQQVSPHARERVLLSEIGDHLEHSQIALIELINSKTNGAVDISTEQVLARELVAMNRLFRRAATDAGEPGMASVLENVELVLVEVANGPPKLSAEEFAALRQRISSDDLLFKVKVVAAQVRARERDLVREMTAKRS